MLSSSAMDNALKAHVTHAWSALLIPLEVVALFLIATTILHLYFKACARGMGASTGKGLALVQNLYDLCMVAGIASIIIGLLLSIGLSMGERDDNTGTTDFFTHVSPYGVVTDTYLKNSDVNPYIKKRYGYSFVSQNESGDKITYMDESNMLHHDCHIHYSNPYKNNGDWYFKILGVTCASEVTPK